MITCLLLLLLNTDWSFQYDVTPDVRILVEVPQGDAIKQFANGTTNIYVKRGSNMVLECEVFNTPIEATVMWKKYPYYGNNTNISPVIINKGMTSYDMSRYRVGIGKQPESIRLEILTVDESYGGVYSCEILYSANTLNAKAERTLMIYDTPQITWTEYSNKVEAGGDVMLMCKATGSPPPAVVWKRVGGNSNIIKNSGVVTYGNNVTISKVTYNEAGMYSCLAENQWGSEERKFMVTVIHAPVVSITPNGEDASQKLGCMLQLTCVVKAYPTPLSTDITWSSTRLKSLVTSGNVVTKLLGSSDQETFYILRIYPTTKADLTDTYTCTATNRMGTGSNSVTVTESAQSNPVMSGPFVCGALRLNISSIALLFIVIVTSLILKSHM